MLQIAVFFIFFIIIGFYFYNIRNNIEQSVDLLGGLPHSYVNEEPIRQHGRNRSFSNNDIKAYVLYIPKRLDYIKNIMHNLNIQPEYVKGVDKSTLNLKDLLYDNIIRKNWYNYSFNGKINKMKKVVNVGRVACHLGHLEIMRRFLNTSNKYALIFEDDLRISNNEYKEVSKKINNILQIIPEDTEILYLSFCWEICKNAIKYNNYLFKSLRPLCRHMYLISRSGAKKIIQNTLPMNNSGDKMIGHMIASKQLKSYSVYNNYLYVKQNRQKTGSFKTNLGNDFEHVLCSTKLSKKFIDNISKPKKFIINNDLLKNNIKLLNDINISSIYT